MTRLTDFLQSGNFYIGDISQKGKAKLAPIYDDAGKPIKVTLARDCSLRTPWPVSSFDGSERCTLDIIMNPQLEQLADKIDANVVQAIHNEPTRYFKNPPKDDWYKSLKKESSREGYAGTLRTKLTIGEERCSFKCWDANKKLMPIEDIRAIQWQSATFAAQVTLKGVYFQSNSYGPLVEVNMLMIKPEDDVCPFQDEESEF